MLVPKFLGYFGAKIRKTFFEFKVSSDISCQSGGEVSFCREIAPGIWWGKELFGGVWGWGERAGEAFFGIWGEAWKIFCNFANRMEQALAEGCGACWKPR